MSRTFSPPGLQRAVGAALALGLALAFALGGCGKKARPTAPSVNLPPQIVQLMPPARGLHVSSETPIWVLFDQPLNPATVNTHHVFLKVDTRRLPISVALDSANRMIRITPLVPLSLVTTHTVELAAGLATAAGDSLGSPFFWQFTVIGLRRLRSPVPSDSTVGESPFARVAWTGTEDFPGGIYYDVFAGTDSGAVANYTATQFGHVTTEFMIPRGRWPQDAVVFWSVRQLNPGTGESMAGPVWRFTPLPSSTPIDSVDVPRRDWDFGHIVNSSFSGPLFSGACSLDSIVIAPGIDNVVRWKLAAVGTNLRLAGAVVLASPLTAYLAIPTFSLKFFSVSNSYSTCAASILLNSYIAPKSDQLLAAETDAGGRIVFLSDTLTANLEAQARYGGTGAFQFQASRRVAIYSPGVITIIPQLAARLRLYVYRPPPAPAVAPRRAGRLARR